MSFSPSPMLLVGTLVAAALVGAVTPANAKPAAVSDDAYVAVARCAGLAEGMGADARPLKTLMRAESGPRDVYVFNAAEEVRADAVIEAKRAGAETLRRLSAEADTACAAFAPRAATVAAR